MQTAGRLPACDASQSQIPLRLDSQVELENAANLLRHIPDTQGPPAAKQRRDQTTTVRQ